ncbi:MAG TPA: AAA family ATPase [Candidatus Saccharimonadales bacterium]|nr:AAA family ATPase [Candidatus Saccharimonadales bacterium]
MRQKQALNVMMGGANVFLTGAPGAGKTYVLNEFVQRAQRSGKRVAVTASTGIAASHLNGTTIHSWSGLGILDELTTSDLHRLGESSKLLKRYNATDILVIDEVSMLHGVRLDMINALAKRLRGSDAAFGGLQVILVGDLYQLPPVSRGSSEFDFAHLSQAWEELDLKTCYLTEQHRQADNDRLLQLLEAMRQDDLVYEHTEILNERMQQQPRPEVVLTRLYSHNIDVEAINQRHLDALPGSSKFYEMHTKGGKAKVEQLAKGLLAPEVLELKIGAEVMFVANNFAEHFVNGSRGRVVGFDGDEPVVQLLNGREIHVEPHSWSLSEDGKVRAEISQLPLRLAWAITIHKSQGMSLDAAQVDLSRAFTPGMGYVALSRVRSLDGLYLTGINAMALRMHEGIHDLDASLRSDSSRLATTTADIAEEVIKTEGDKQPLNIDQDLFEKLKTWRVKRAAADSVPAYIIAHNTTLEALAANPPSTPQQLIAMPGFGPKKAAAYGPDVLAIIAKHRASS